MLDEPIGPPKPSIATIRQSDQWRRRRAAGRRCSSPTSLIVKMWLDRGDFPRYAERFFELVRRLDQCPDRCRRVEQAARAARVRQKYFQYCHLLIVRESVMGYVLSPARLMAAAFLLASAAFLCHLDLTARRGRRARHAKADGGSARVHHANPIAFDVHFGAEQ